MRLLILHQAWEFGGAERTTAALIRGLQPGPDTEIVVAGPTCLPRIIDLGSAQFEDVSMSIPHGWFPASARLVRRDIDRAAQLLDRTRPDVALGMMHYSGALLALAAQRLSRPIPVIAAYRGPISQYIWRHERGFRRKLLIYRYLVKGTRAASLIAVPFEGTASDTLRHFLAPTDRLRVIPNGLDAKAVARMALEPNDALDSTELRGPVICVAARLSKEKAVDLLIHAAAALPQNLPWHLIIIGEGPERRTLQALTVELGVHARVTFIGHQANVYPIVNRAAIYVHTCEFEGFGYAMLEAMILGTPVIATDCPTGPRELLSPGSAGLLVKSGSIKALTHAMQHLLLNPEERSALAARARDRARTFTTDAMVAGFQRLFSELMPT